MLSIPTHPLQAPFLCIAAEKGMDINQMRGDGLRNVHILNDLKS